MRVCSQFAASRKTVLRVDINIKVESSANLSFLPGGRCSPHTYLMSVEYLIRFHQSEIPFTMESFSDLEAALDRVEDTLKRVIFMDCGESRRIRFENGTINI